MKTRIILTVLAVIGWFVFNVWSPSIAPLVAGNTSVQQLDNSDIGYMEAKVGTTFNGAGISALALLIVLGVIWASFIVRKFTGATVALLAMFLLVGSSAHATVLDKNTYLSEYKNIKPNQTAFLIPMQGANKTSQGQFDSISYLDANKVPTKRVQIPHVILERASTIGNMIAADQYIPTSCLYIVGREPYTRLWTKDNNRGTSKDNEGTFVETSESINIDFGTVISAHINPTNAALYLYHFGVSSSQIDAGDDVNFPSVVYARSLNEVMDTVVFNDAHRLLAVEFGKRSFRECISQKAQIILSVEQKLKDTYAANGITIEYFGMASQLNFDIKLQEAVNNVAIAELDASAASNRLAAMPVLQALADINMKNQAAIAFSKWDGKIPQLPSFAVLPSGLFDGIGNMLGFKK
jgi:hypothetical protein